MFYCNYISNFAYYMSTYSNPIYQSTNKVRRHWWRRSFIYITPFSSSRSLYIVHYNTFTHLHTHYNHIITHSHISHRCNIIYSQQNVLRGPSKKKKKHIFSLWTDMIYPHTKTIIFLRQIAEDTSKFSHMECFGKY